MRYSKSFSPQIKVCFAPKFVNSNPYLESLYSHLEKLGIKSNGVEDYKLFLPKEVGKEDSNILHLHWLHRFYHRTKDEISVRVFIKFIIGLIILKSQKTSIIWTAHNIKSHEDTSFILDWLCNFFVIHISDAIITHSYSAKDAISIKYNLKRNNKISVIPHANYIGQYQNNVSKEESKKILNLSDSYTIFLFFGIIRSYKGIPELIESFKSIHNPTAHLIIAGSPRDSKLAQSILEEIRNESRITYVPRFIPNNEVELFMNASDIVIFPYRNILTSGAILLAMSFGRACIAPNMPSVTEVLDSEGSFLYDPNNQDGLVNAMKQALDKQEDLSAMGQYNLEKSKKWGWNEVAHATKEVYCNCLQSKNKKYNTNGDSI